MLTLTKASAQTEYTYPDDKDVVCTIRPLSTAERAEVRDMVNYNEDGTVNMNINKQHVYIVLRCLKSIKGIEGNPEVTDELIDMLPMKLISAIGNEVYRISEAQTETKK